MMTEQIGMKSSYSKFLLNKHIIAGSIGCALYGNLVLQMVFRICQGCFKLSGPSGLQCRGGGTGPADPAIAGPMF